MYQHQNFSLDPQKREVRDENGKRVPLAGNPYLLLELLCQRHPASVTINDINLALDPAGAQNYTEAHVRRMKNVIRTAIGREVVRYTNRVYSLSEDAKTYDEWNEENPLIKKLVADVRNLKSIILERDGMRLCVHARTADGGELTYTNERFQGTL